MLFFTSGRVRAPRRSRDVNAWLDAMPAVDPATALRHARDDIADAARQLIAAAPDHPEDLLPSAGRDAVRKSVQSVQKLVPVRRRRRRWPLFGLVAALVGLGALFLATQVLLRRPSLPMRLSRGWTPGRGTSWSSTSALATEPGAIAPPPTPRPLEGLPIDADSEPATFDRDAGIRAATEGMELREPMTRNSTASQVSEGE